MIDIVVARVERGVAGCRVAVVARVALDDDRTAAAAHAVDPSVLAGDPARAPGGEQRRELAYEAMLADDRTRWDVGTRVRVYRTAGGGAALVRDPDDDLDGRWARELRDYDVDHYVRLLRTSFATRLVRAFTADDFAAVFADPDQLSLFAPALETIRPVLTAITET